MNMEAPKVKRLPAGDLKTGQSVWLAGMVMQFSHWQGNVPVYLNRHSLIELAN